MDKQDQIIELLTEIRDILKKEFVKPTLSQAIKSFLASCDAIDARRKEGVSHSPSPPEDHDQPTTKGEK